MGQLHPPAPPASPTWQHPNHSPLRSVHLGLGVFKPSEYDDIIPLAACGLILEYKVPLLLISLQADHYDPYRPEFTASSGSTAIYYHHMY